MGTYKILYCYFALGSLAYFTLALNMAHQFSQLIIMDQSKLLINLENFNQSNVNWMYHLDSTVWAYCM